MTANTETAANPSWLITFLLYDNAWYDKKHKGETGYISLEQQNNALYASIAQMALHENIKIVLLEAKINVPDKVLEVYMRTKSGKEEMTMNTITPATVTSAVMSNTESLAALLQPVLEVNNADRHILVTVGHGSIFGVNLYSEKDDTDTPRLNNAFIKLASQKIAFGIDPNLKAELANNKAIADLLPKSMLKRINIKQQMDILLNGKDDKNGYEVFVPELNITVLTVKEIGEALLSVFENKIVDIMVLDNCLMQNIFTQYELSKKVNYLVAAESGISYPGFNYKAIIEKINANINIPPQDLANEFVTENTIKSHPAYATDSVKATVDRHWCVNTVALEEAKYSVIKTAFDNLFSLLYALIKSPVKKISNEIYYVIRTTNDQLFGYNSYSLPTIKIIDLRVFLIYLKERITDNTVLTDQRDLLLNAIEKMQTAIKDIKVKSFIGEQFYPARNYYVDEMNKDSIGIGFLLPAKPCGEGLINALIKKDGQIAYAPKFLENSDYYKFINCFWAMTPPNFF